LARGSTRPDPKRVRVGPDILETGLARAGSRVSSIRCGPVGSTRVDLVWPCHITSPMKRGDIAPSPPPYHPSNANIDTRKHGGSETTRASMRAPLVRCIFLFLFVFTNLTSGEVPPLPTSFRADSTRTGRVQPLPTCFRRVLMRTGKVQPFSTCFRQVSMRTVIRLRSVYPPKTQMSHSGITRRDDVSLTRY